MQSFAEKRGWVFPAVNVPGPTIPPNWLRMGMGGPPGRDPTTGWPAEAKR